jgi:serine O-acetyltransferase
MFSNLEEDYLRYSGGKRGSLIRYVYKSFVNAGFRAVMLYRTGSWLKKHNVRFLPGLCERLMHHLCFCWISVNAEIEPGFLIAHVGGIGIGPGTHIGKNCDIRRNLSLGGNFNKKDAEGRDHPWIGNNVSFGVGAVVSGPVRVGSNSIIGANTVVTRDIPENVIVFGVPGRIIKERWAENSDRHL